MMSQIWTRISKAVLIGLVVSVTGGLWQVVQAYETVDVKDGGRITGTVTFVGTPPQPETLTVDRDQEKCGVESHLSESLVVSKTGGIQNVVVSIENIEKGKAQPALEQNPTLVQEKCRFNPHVLLVPADSTIDLYNRDKAMHNIHTVSKANPVVNKAHPSFKKRLRFKLRKPETIKVKCDMHTWMSGWFVVTEHPYYVITAADGTFSLSDVPPGTYTLKAWHETLGTQTQEIEIQTNGETKADFAMKP